MDKSLIHWLKNLSLSDADYFGEKVAYLAELYNHKLPVPNAFVIDSKFYDGIIHAFRTEIESALSMVSDLKSAYEASNTIKTIFSRFTITPEIQNLLLDNYKKINEHPDHENMSALTRQLVTSGRDLPFLAIRLSPTKNFPFQFESSLNVYGIEQVCEGLKSALASIFSPWAIYYRYKHNIGHFDFSVSVIVQKMVHAVKSGDMFTIDPIKNSKTDIYAQVIWGMNAGMLHNPAVFVFNKQTNVVNYVKEVNQQKYYTKNAQFGELLLETLPSNLSPSPTLSEGERKALSDLSAQVESIMNFPQYIEWAIVRNSIHILQTRPITQLFSKPLIYTDKGILINNLTSEGQATLISTNDDFQKFTTESILVTNESERELFPYLVQAKGYVCGSTGLTSPAIQICKDFSVPAIIQNNTKSIEDGQDIKFSGNSLEIIQPIQQSSEQTSSSDYGASNTTDESNSSENTYLSGSEDMHDFKHLIFQFEQLERSLTEQVSKEAQRRAAGEHTSEEDFKRSQLVSELEWQIRNLKRKLEEANQL